MLNIWVREILEKLKIYDIDYGSTEMVTSKWDRNKS